MGKNVAVFVDVANIFYAAKAAGTDIDYVTLLKAATAGRDFVRAYAYTGLDPDNENQRNFHAFLARNHYKVVSKDIRKYGDGKVKANLDIELVVDMMKTARNLDIAIVVSGDGDFAPAIRAVQEMGVRVEVISFRGNTSSDLIDVADLFTDITQLARVDKSSSRSGRRVAGDDEDLSMTEVPDKQTEGTGARGRGRGRGRGRPGEAEPAAAAPRRGGRTSSVVPTAAVAASVNGGGSLTVLPGEKLSRVAPAATSEVDLDLDVDEEELETIEVEGEEMVVDGDGRRRRRRRGGRGRGRGRGRGEEALGARGGRVDPGGTTRRRIRGRRGGRGGVAGATQPAHDPVRLVLGLAARRPERIERTGGAGRPGRRRRGLRRARDPRIPDRRAAARSSAAGSQRWWRRWRGPWRRSRRPKRLYGGRRARALRPRWWRGRHQPLSRRERPRTPGRQSRAQRWWRWQPRRRLCPARSPRSPGPTGSPGTVRW